MGGLAGMRPMAPGLLAPPGTMPPGELHTREVVAVSHPLLCRDDDASYDAPKAWNDAHPNGYAPTTPTNSWHARVSS